MWLRSGHKRIMLFLYDLRDSPEKRVGPDPRRTVQGIARGIGMSAMDVYKHLDKLIKETYVTCSDTGGSSAYFYLTVYGQDEVEKQRKTSVKARLGSDKAYVEAEMSETKGRHRG